MVASVGWVELETGVHRDAHRRSCAPRMGLTRQSMQSNGLRVDRAGSALSATNPASTRSMRTSPVHLQPQSAERSIGGHRAIVAKHALRTETPPRAASPSRLQEISASASWSGGGRSQGGAIATRRPSVAASRIPAMTASTCSARSPLARCGRPSTVARAKSARPRPRSLANFGPFTGQFAFPKVL